MTHCGRICMHRKKVNISTVMARLRLGIKEVDDAIWLVSCMHHDLGYIAPGAENTANRRQPVRRKVVTHVLGAFCNVCLRAGPRNFWRRGRDSNPR